VAIRDTLDAPVHGHPLEQAESLLGHSFGNRPLLREALTHRSAARRGRESNERLEFVGDRVLGLLIAEWVAERFPHEQEGELGVRLADLVSQPVLAGVAERVGLAEVLTVSAGESRAGVRHRATVLADAMEAAIGALYIDAGLAPARAFVRRAWEQVITAQIAPPKDAKTALQEWAQARGLPLPEYIVESREGPPHAPVFVIGVSVAGATGTGRAGTKRAAEQLAAVDLLERMA
jgi:ribonuclease-3